jgi:hypothetical protein
VPGFRLVPLTRFLISLWRLQVSWCGAPSLTRGRVCNLLVQLLLDLARAVTLGSKSRRTQTIFYCLIWDSPNLVVQFPVFISPRNGMAQLYPWALGSLSVASYDSQGCGGVILTCLHSRMIIVSGSVISAALLSTPYLQQLVVYIWPPLWSSGQSSWLQMRRPGFDSRHYQKKNVVGLERGALSLVSTAEELLDRKVAAPV